MINYIEILTKYPALRHFSLIYTKISGAVSPLSSEIAKTVDNAPAS